MTGPEDEPTLEEPTFRGGTSDQGPPELDQAAVGRVARVVDIVSVELVGLIFEQDELGPLRSTTQHSAPEDVGISVEWEYRQSAEVLGCAVSFAIDTETAAGEDSDRRTKLRARFRLTYHVPELGLTAFDLDQFAHWNVVFNAWPYWRELAQSVLTRAGMDPILMPVFRMPRADGPTVAAQPQID